MYEMESAKHRGFDIGGLADARGYTRHLLVVSGEPRGGWRVDASRIVSSIHSNRCVTRCTRAQAQRGRPTESHRLGRTNGSRPRGSGRGSGAIARLRRLVPEGPPRRGRSSRSPLSAPGDASPSIPPENRLERSRFERDSHPVPDPSGRRHPAHLGPSPAPRAALPAGRPGPGPRSRTGHEMDPAAPDPGPERGGSQGELQSWRLRPGQGVSAQTAGEPMTGKSRSKLAD